MAAAGAAASTSATRRVIDSLVEYLNSDERVTIRPFMHAGKGAFNPADCSGADPVAVTRISLTHNLTASPHSRKFERVSQPGGAR